MEIAMDSLSDKYEFRVRWEPFLLRPNMPPEGIPKPASYQDTTSQRSQYLIEAGASVGAEFTYKCPVFPNTLKAHALLEYSKEKDDGEKQNEVAEKLFKLYFTDGDQLLEETLLSVADQVGFNKTEVQNHINNKEVLEGVFNKAVSYSQRGISGVPYFYFNGQKMFSGAQEIETFKRMFDIAADKFPLQNPSSKS